MFCCFLRSTTVVLTDVLRCSLRGSGSHSKVSRVIYNGAGVEGKIPHGVLCEVTENIKAVLKFSFSFMFKGYLGTYDPESRSYEEDLRICRRIPDNTRHQQSFIHFQMTFVNPGFLGFKRNQQSFGKLQEPTKDSARQFLTRFSESFLRVLWSL